MKPFYFEAFNFEEELPEYDLDTEDEDWLNNFNKKKVRPMAVLIFPGWTVLWNSAGLNFLTKVFWLILNNYISRLFFF